MQIRTLVVLLASSVLAAAVNSYEIANQADANALPATIDGDLIIARDFHADLVLPGVKAVGGTVSYQGGNDLGTFTAPDLESVGSALILEGTYREVSLPALKLVKGGMRLVSASPDFDCSEANALRVKGVVRGRFLCKSGTLPQME